MKQWIIKTTKEMTTEISKSHNKITKNRPVSFIHGLILPSHGSKYMYFMYAMINNTIMLIPKTNVVIKTRYFLLTIKYAHRAV